MSPAGVLLAEWEGFEPSIQETRIHALQACPFNHSGTTPGAVPARQATLSVQGASGGVKLGRGILWGCVYLLSFPTPTTK